MPLSENEQKMLEQMERALYAEDPRFASQMRGGRLGSAPKQRIVVGACAVVAGLGLVVAGVATELVALGVVGFVVMVAGVAWAVTPARAAGAGQGTDGPAGPSGRRGPRRGRSGPKNPGSPKGTDSSGSFTQRMEDRWEKRRREGQW